MQDIDDSDVGGRQVSAELRRQLAAQGKITGWDNENRRVVAGYSPSDVKKHCVMNDEWQGIRLSMKGVDTYRKLEILEAWWDQNLVYDSDFGTYEALWSTEVQVGNYLGALVRGGQLNNERQIRKAR